MFAYVIRMDSDGLPLYFEPKAARGLGGNALQGWTQDKAQALAFARKSDAQSFIDGMMPRAGAQPEVANVESE